MRCYFPYVHTIVSGRDLTPYMVIASGKEITLIDYPECSATIVMAQLNVGHHIADKALNHVGDAIKGVVVVYQRHDYLSGMRGGVRRLDSLHAEKWRKKREANYLQAMNYHYGGKLSAIWFRFSCQG